MFKWMNRRLYHTIRIWFKVFGSILLTIGIAVAHVKGVYFINHNYGQNAAYFSALVMSINLIIMIFSWLYAGIAMEDYQYRCKQIMKCDTISFRDRIFLSMNRKIHHAIFFYVFTIITLVTSISMLTGLVILIDWIATNFGSGVAIVSIIGFFAFVASVVIAWVKSEDALEEEIKEQNRVLKALKKDWT